MLEKKVIEDIFAKYYVIDPPKNIIILDKPALSLQGQSMTFYRGLQPKWRGDIVVLTPQGNDETLVHETLHAQYKAGEPMANIGGKVLVVKYRMINRKRFIARVWRLRHRDREINYQMCHGCQLCNDLTALKIHPPDGAKPVHYYLVDSDGR